MDLNIYSGKYIQGFNYFMFVAIFSIKNKQLFLTLEAKTAEMPFDEESS